jgi:hypothetical protein
MAGVAGARPATGTGRGRAERPDPADPQPPGFPFGGKTEDDLVKTKVARVPGKQGGELVPVHWLDNGAGTRMAWASEDDILRPQFEREVRRLFPLAHDYEITVVDGEYKAVVR